MPTKKAFVFSILALALYLLANQTQVGWVYMMTNGLVGLLFAALFYSSGMLKPIRIRRTFQNLAAHPSVSSLLQDNHKPNQTRNGTPNNDSLLNPPSFFEDDPIEITLEIEHTRLKPAFLVSGQEVCPFAPPSDQVQPFFVSSLFKGQSISLSYQTTCHRRGLFAFSSLKLRSKGPFSLFSTRHALDAPDELLIYPKYHPLKRLRLLENKGFADRRALRVGVSSEVIGTREYRSGDSLRQIHWRSTARLGKLVVKEFLDQDQLTMTVVLDLSTGGSIGQGKFSTFETAVRLAASLGYYAACQNIPFYLAGHSRRWQPPAMALSWPGTLSYLAKVKNDGQEPLDKVLRNLPSLPFVVVLAGNPNQSISRELALLQRKGAQTLAIFIAPDGALPVSALNQSDAELEVKTVGPHNWAALLDEL